MAEICDFQEFLLCPRNNKIVKPCIYLDDDVYIGKQEDVYGVLPL